MTKIQWTNRTWNPTTGCKMVSEGCRFCYAEKMSKRLAGMGQEKYKGILTDKGKFNGVVRTHDAELMKPFTWKKPCMVFVNSMSDLFHEDVPFEFIDKVFAVMALTPHITYQILTKRPERMAEYLVGMREEGFTNGYVADHLGDRAWRYFPQIPRHLLKTQNEDRSKMKWPLPNVWLGTSVENQAAANERIRHLLACPSAVRFLSCEPLLGPVDITNKGLKNAYSVPTRFVGGHPCEWTDPGDKFIGDIHWVIAGGESGSPKARPMHPDWARMLRDQCANAGVPFFFKQWGEYGTTFQLLDGSPTFYQFHSFQNWVNKAGAWMRGNICVDTKGRVLKIGGDFMLARDEDAFPVVLLKKMGKHKSGRLLDGVEHDEFPQRSKP